MERSNSMQVFVLNILQRIRRDQLAEALDLLLTRGELGRFYLIQAEVLRSRVSRLESRHYDEPFYDIKRNELTSLIVNLVYDVLEEYRPSSPKHNHGQ